MYVYIYILHKYIQMRERKGFLAIARSPWMKFTVNALLCNSLCQILSLDVAGDVLERCSHEIHTLDVFSSGQDSKSPLCSQRVMRERVLCQVWREPQPTGVAVAEGRNVAVSNACIYAYVNMYNDIYTMHTHTVFLFIFQRLMVTP